MNSRLALPLVIFGAIFSSPAVYAQQAPRPPQAPPPRPSGPIEVNGIAAKVNGRVVTKYQVSFMLAPVYAQLVTQFPRRGAQFEKNLFFPSRLKCRLYQHELQCHIRQRSFLSYRL